LLQKQGEEGREAWFKKHPPNSPPTFAYYAFWEVNNLRYVFRKKLLIFTFSLNTLIMMRRIVSLSFLLLLTGMILTSCNKNKQDDPTDESISLDQLRKGAWTIDHVDVNSFDGSGALIGTQRFPFGEGTDGGICTFNYDASNLWTLNDNGDIFTSRYNLDDNIVYTDGGGTWGIRKMTDTDLEIVLRSDNSLNPCNYTVSGAVYTLYRGTR
jgi:hypothetical protein